MGGTAGTGEGIAGAGGTKAVANIGTGSCHVAAAALGYGDGVGGGCMKGAGAAPVVAAAGMWRYLHLSPCTQRPAR